jgi:integrase/recombinase XerC
MSKPNGRAQACLGSPTPRSPGAVRSVPEPPVVPSHLLGEVLRHLSCSRLTDQTVQRMAELMTRFVTYLEKGHGIHSIADVAEEHAEGFIFASMGLSGHRRPAPATMHLRRSALRLYFRTARELGTAIGDPTLDIVLPARSGLSGRPLTDDEIALGRSFSLNTLNATRRPAAWALAEATARTSEIPRIQAADVDAEGARVWISGSTKAEPRWGRLSDWGLQQVLRRVESLSSTDSALVYEGNGSEQSRQASSCIAISQTLLDAGLDREPDVRPGSVVGWAGRRIFEETASIDEVARRLGVRSLDRAASIIAWDWTGNSCGEKGGTW